MGVEPATRTRQGPAGPHPGDEVRDGRKIADDLLRRPLLVSVWVGGVPVLERHVVPLVGSERARHLDRAVRSLRTVRQHDLGAE